MGSGMLYCFSLSLSLCLSLSLSLSLSLDFWKLYDDNRSKYSKNANCSLYELMGQVEFNKTENSHFSCF